MTRAAPPALAGIPTFRARVCAPSPSTACLAGKEHHHHNCAQGDDPTPDRAVRDFRGVHTRTYAFVELERRQRLFGSRCALSGLPLHSTPRHRGGLRVGRGVLPAGIVLAHVPLAVCSPRRWLARRWTPGTEPARPPSIGNGGCIRAVALGLYVSHVTTSLRHVHSTV